MTHHRDVYLENITWERALKKFLKVIREQSAPELPRKEIVKVEEALGRVTASPVFARVSYPHYNSAAMDGVAVKAGDTFGAGEKNPLYLTIGKNAVEVDTGDILPEGSDAVIKIEDIVWQNNGKEIKITASVFPGQNIRPVGEDIKSGQLVLPAGECLCSYDLGALLAAGCSEIEVYAKPRVAILPTGSELVPPLTTREPGKIPEFNSIVLGNQVVEWGGVPRYYSPTPDICEEIKSKVAAAVKENDIVIINAGSSAGRKDHTSRVIEELGEVLVHGVALRPGKPVVLGLIERKPVLGIPGYPVSAFLAMDIFTRPLVYTFRGLETPPKSRVKARVKRKVPSTLGADEFLRVNLCEVDGEMTAVPAGRGAGMISALAGADGFMHIPFRNEGVLPGSEVEVELLRPPERIRRTFLIAGSYDPGLDILGYYLHLDGPCWRVIYLPFGSLGGLKALTRGEAHCAGLHYFDAGIGNGIPDEFEKIITENNFMLLHFARREIGLLLGRSNPKKIKSLEDLVDSEIRFINYKLGSETRSIFDKLLASSGIETAKIPGYDREKNAPFDIAAAISSGMADAGPGFRATAEAFELDFLALADEWYDICIPADKRKKPPLPVLFSILHDRDFRREVESLGGYDLSTAGSIVMGGDALL